MSPTLSTVSVRKASAVDEQRVVSVIVAAFAADPAARWAYPDARDYLTYFPDFVKAFGGKAFACASAYYVDGFCGAALWLPPGEGVDEEKLDALLESTLPEHIRQDAAALFEQMGQYHPDEPHWYLPMIGVDIPMQGCGYGSALLQHTLAVCDSEGRSAYLESSNPRNVPLYKRHGFEVIGTIQAGSSPEIYPMLRKPR